MRKTMLLTATMAVMLASFAGAALAVDKTCTANQTCRGTSQADGLTGTRFADKIIGLAGDDVIFGKSGDDTVNGGAGNDAMRGDAGDDTIRGQAGNDSLLGGANSDTLIGDDPSDDNGGVDNLAGAAGNDVSRGGGNGDLFGNISFSGKEEDIVYDRGEDQFFGEGGNDRFYAVDGEKDTIDCGPGRDTVYKERIDETENCEVVYVRVQSDRSADSGKGEIWAPAVKIK